MKKLFVILILAGFVFVQNSFAIDVSNYDKAILKTAKAIASASTIPPNTKIVVVGFKETSSKKRLLVSAVIEDDVSNYLINKLPGRIIAKNSIDTVLKELKITREDIFEVKNRKDFGKLLSADVIITGSYLVNGENININIIAVNIESGIALFSDRFVIPRNSFPRELFAISND